jgi:hypothetical protein
MTQSPVVERTEETPAPLPSIPLSPGVGRLLHGQKDQPPAELADTERHAPAPAADSSTSFVRALMITADFLLIAMACALVWKSATPFGFAEILLCSAALGLGGVLSCIAVLWRR